MKITIRHELRIDIGPGGPRALQHVLLTPLSGPSQTVKDWALDMPGIDTAARFTDAFGNRALLVCQAKSEEQLRIAVNGVVETSDRNGIIGRVPGDPVVALYKRATPLTQPDPDLVAGFTGTGRHGAARIALLHAIMARLGELYRFGPAEAGPQLVEMQATGAQRQTQGPTGQSQSQGGQTQSQGAAPQSNPGDSGPADADAEAAPDTRQQADAPTFAHAFVATVRALDLPARYVTGYLSADENHPAAFHAWAEAWDDGLGWIAFDAALGLCPTDRHVRVATGLDGLATQPVRAVPQASPPVETAIEATAVAQ